MKRIVDYRKLFNADQNTDLAQLKLMYRKLVKEWHPDKFQDGDVLKQEAEIKSKVIIDAYHFLVSIAPETREANLEEYTQTVSTNMITDFHYKGQLLKVTFVNGSVYEYFGVKPNVYTKLVNAATPERFARRHVFHSHLFRNVTKAVAVEETV
ncbi:MAG: KTSC domain-containing protein [Bacteroidota bacterium]